jgi:hypothetical protein
MRWRERALGILAGSLALAGCGGGSGGSEVGVCTDAFTACGGDPTGSWQITGICLDASLTTILNEAWASPSCAGSVESASLSLSGTVTYNAGTVTYDQTTVTSMKASYYLACMAETLGVSSPDATGCAALQASLDDGSGPAASCTFSDACHCEVTESATNQAANGYTTAGASITESDGSTYDFCVTGAAMSQRAELWTTGRFGIMTLAKQ